MNNGSQWECNSDIVANSDLILQKIYGKWWCFTIKHTLW